MVEHLDRNFQMLKQKQADSNRDALKLTEESAYKQNKLSDLHNSQ